MELSKISLTPRSPTVPKPSHPAIDTTGGRGLVDIEVTVIAGTGLTNSHKLRRNPSFSVQLKLDSETKNTDAKQSEDDAVTWNTDFVFSSTMVSSLKIRVYCKHQHFREDHVVGEASFELLSVERNKDIEIELHLPDGLTQKRTSPFLTLRLKAALSVLFSIQHDADMDFQSASCLKQMERIVGSLSSDKLKELPPAWIRLFSSLNSFSSWAQAVAELDSRAKVAVGAVAFAIKVLVDQIKRDKKIDNLGCIMCDLYAYVLDGCSIRKITSFEKTLQRLLTQTAECAYFITDYHRISVFTQRAVANIMSNADSMILNFEAAFRELKIALILGSSLQTTLVSYRILQTMEHLVDRMLIDRLPILDNVGWDSEKTCLRGTREMAIQKVVHWVSGNHDTTSSSRVYLLSGPIASGKSTIAHTIAKVFHEQNRLGAAVFLRGQDPEVNAQKISSTIIHHLAEYDSSLHARIAAKIKADHSLTWADSKRQFRALLTTESTDNKLVMIGPVLIVIDGLDKVDDEEQLKTLAAIADHSGSLPPNFRILLTCQSGNIATQKLQDRLTSHVHDIGFDDTESGNNLSSSQLLSQTLEDIFSKHPNLPIQCHIEEGQVDEVKDQLEKRARGMYYWVSTVCRALQLCEADDINLLLTLILSSTPSLSNDDAVDQLYHALFKVLFPDNVSARRLFDIMIRQQPMTWSQLLQIAFYTPQPAKENVEAYIARQLGLVIEQGQDENGISLFGVHPTLEGFLTNPHRCHGSGIYIDREAPLDRSAAEFCLYIMNESLRHNICNIEDVMIMNAEITDKDSRVEQYIPNSLRYACCNWTLHLEREDNLNLDEALFQQLRKFVLTHMLHWIEAMSLLGRVDDIHSSLFRFSRWIQKWKIERSDIFYMLTTFATHFVRTFSGMISKAALQTYNVALSLMPSDTMLFRHLSNGVGDKFMSSITTQYRWDVERPLFPNNTARSSCCSHDALVALGSMTGGVRFEDARTGADVECRITIDEEVEGLSFSPDGADLATITVSGRFAIHNVKTGMCVSSSNTSLSRGAFITYSDDGTTIVAVSKHRETAEGTIDCYICDALTGDLRLLKTLPIRNPSKIALSPDGRKLAIPSESGIQFFDLDSGDNVGVLDNSWLVTWSPDAAFMAIVPGGGNMIHIWSFRDESSWKIDIDNTSNSATLWAWNFSLNSSRIAFVWSYVDDMGPGSILKVQVWDTETTSQIGEATINEGPIHCKRRQLSFGPDGQEIIILSDVYRPSRSGVEYQTLVYLLSDTSPAYMTSPPTFRDFKPAPTVFLSFSGKGERCEYPPTDADGWITNSAGRRMFMVPYPNFDVLSSLSLLSSTYTCLDIKHPESKKTVLKCVINWNEKADSDTEARDVVSTPGHPNIPIRSSLLTHHLTNMY